jgi:uncharacterized protein
LLLEDQPARGEPRAWVLLVHGLGGCSGRPGVRRLAMALQAHGFGVWRLNLRGAGAGRSLATGTYAAACNSDLLPVLAAARQRAGGLSLLGTGLSLGGTVLLNALLERPDGLDALTCVSSPLDLAACADQIDAPRNRLYQRVLLRGLVRQTLADSQPIDAGQAVVDRQAQLAVETLRGIRSIRQFDTAVTAPRWGYPTVEAYYHQASPLPALIGGATLPPVLFLHARDDPWVPAAAVLRLQAQAPASMEVCVPRHGGHNGFHGKPGFFRAPAASWSDVAVVGWLAQRCG